MFRSTRLAIFAAVLAGATAMGASEALSGDRHHAVGIAVYHYDVPWYHQPPWIGTGPGHYYSHYPDHVPSYPEPRTGTPVPIFRTDQPVASVVVRRTLVVSGAHAEWCAARYRSYDARTDTYQPYHGPRRFCRSPYR